MVFETLATKMDRDDFENIGMQYVQSHETPLAIDAGVPNALASVPQIMQG